MYSIELTIGSVTKTVTPMSLTLPEQVCSDTLTHVELSLPVTLEYDAELLNFLISADTVNAIVKEGEEVKFTGGITTNLSFKDIGQPLPIESISLTIKDNTYKLKTKLDTELVLLNETLSEIISSIAVGCDLETVIPEALSSITLPIFIIEKGQQYLNALNQLCFSYKYSFYFDADGALCFFNFDSIPASVDELNGYHICTNEVSRQTKQYTGVKIGYNKIITKLNELVYYEGFGFDSQNKPAPAIIQPGVYFPFESSPIVEATEGQVYQSFESGFAEAIRKFNGELEYRRSKKTTLIYTQNHTLVEDWEGDLTINRTEYESKRASVRFINNSTLDVSLYQLAIRADAWYRTDECEVLAGDTGTPYEYDAQYVYDAVTAENLAKCLFKYFTLSQFTFKTKHDLKTDFTGTYKKIRLSTGAVCKSLCIAQSYDPTTDITYATWLTVSSPSFIQITASKNTSGTGTEQGAADNAQNTADTALDQINDIVEGTTDEESSPAPNTLTLSSAIAEQNKIVLTAQVLGQGLKNSLKKVIFYIQKTVGGVWEEYENESYVFEYFFDRATDGYPEAGTYAAKDLGNWTIRAKAVNIYGKVSAGYSNEILVNTDTYGTWYVLPPDVISTQSANRAANVIWQRKDKTPLGKDIYGISFFDIQISMNGSTWFKPAQGKTGKESESDWQDGEGQVRLSGGGWSQSLPLHNQTINLPENTTYYYRVRTRGITEDYLSAWSDPVTTIALATGIGDIIAKTVKEAQLDNSSVSNIKIQDGTIVASEKVVSNTITTELLNVLAKNKINNFSVTGTLEGWTTSGTLEDDVSGFKKLRFTNSGFLSNAFPVQPNEICSFEFGIACPNYTSNSGAFIGLTVGQSFKNYAWSFTLNKWIAGVVNSNDYFIRDYKATTVKYFKTYILGSNVSINDIPAPAATDATYAIWALQLQGTDTTARLRTGFNPITAGTYWELYLPQVYSGQGGKIVAQQIITPSLSAINVNAGEITSGVLRAIIKAGESKPNVFLDLDTEEFRVGNNPSLEDSNHEDAEYLHWIPNIGLFLKLKNLIVDALASTIRGRFRIRGTTATMAQSVLIVNPESTVDPDTNTPANTAELRIPLQIKGSLQVGPGEQFLVNTENVVSTIPSYLQANVNPQPGDTRTARTSSDFLKQRYVLNSTSSVLDSASNVYPLNLTGWNSVADFYTNGSVKIADCKWASQTVRYVLYAHKTSKTNTTDTYKLIKQTKPNVEASAWTTTWEKSLTFNPAVRILLIGDFILVFQQVGTYGVTVHKYNSAGTLVSSTAIAGLSMYLAPWWQTEDEEDFSCCADSSGAYFWMQDNGLVAVIDIATLTLQSTFAGYCQPVTSIIAHANYQVLICNDNMRLLGFNPSTKVISILGSKVFNLGYGMTKNMIVKLSSTSYLFIRPLHTEYGYVFITIGADNSITGTTMVKVTQAMNFGSLDNVTVKNTKDNYIHVYGMSSDQKSYVRLRFQPVGTTLNFVDEAIIKAAPAEYTFTRYYSSGPSIEIQPTGYNSGVFPPSCFTAGYLSSWQTEESKWKKLNTYRYVAGESPTTTYYWYKVCKITTAMTFDIEVVSDQNLAYRASYRLSVSTYKPSYTAYTAYTAYTVALFNLGQATIGQAKLAVAIDADGYLYIQTNAIWACSLFVTLLYSATSSFSITMDKLGYAPFGTESGFTPVNLIIQTGAFRWTDTGGITSSTPIINTDVVGNVTGNVTGNADTATALATASTINGASFDATEDIELPIAEYSTTEKRIGTWIDGRPLYRKVVNVGPLKWTGTTSAAHGITNLDIVVKVDAVAWNTDKTNFEPLPFMNPSTNEGIKISISKTNVSISTYGAFNSFTSSMSILTYVKT